MHVDFVLFLDLLQGRRKQLTSGPAQGRIQDCGWSRPPSSAREVARGVWGHAPQEIFEF